jgi:hypothetical protein
MMFYHVISVDTLSHGVKVTVCTPCLSLRLNFTGILINCGVLLVPFLYAQSDNVGCP